MRLQLAVADGGGAQRSHRDAGEELRLELRVGRTRRRAGRAGCGAGPVSDRAGDGVLEAAERARRGPPEQGEGLLPFGDDPQPCRAGVGGGLAGDRQHRACDGYIWGLLGRALADGIAEDVDPRQCLLGQQVLLAVEVPVDALADVAGPGDLATVITSMLADSRAPRPEGVAGQLGRRGVR